MTIPLISLPIIDPTGRPPIELVGSSLGTGSEGSGSGKASSPGECTFHAGGTPIELVDFTGALTEWCVYQRDKFDLTAWTEARVVVDVVAAAPPGAVLEVQYAPLGPAAPDEGAWATLCTVPLDAVGTQVGTFAPLPTNSAADVWLRWVTRGA